MHAKIGVIVKKSTKQVNDLQKFLHARDDVAYAFISVGLKDHWTQLKVSVCFMDDEKWTCTAERVGYWAHDVGIMINSFRYVFQKKLEERCEAGKDN